MFKFITAFIAKYRSRAVTKNIFYLFVTQIINYLFPFIIFQHLIQVLGVANFGKISFVQALITYLSIFVDYGFNLSATASISKVAGDKVKVRQIVSEVLSAKLLLTVFAFIAMVFSVIFVDKFNELKLLYYYFFGMVLGSALFPQWYFLGIQKMQYITLINLLIKVIFLIAVFVFIRSKSQFMVVPIIYSISYLLPSIIALFIVFKQLGSFIIPKIKRVITTLKEGFSLFLSSALASVSSGVAILVLGFLSTNEIVGYFAGYDKVVKSFFYLILPISTAVFPILVKAFESSDKDGERMIRKTSFLMISCALILIALLNITLPLIVKILFTPDYIDYAIIVRILSFWIFFSVINQILGIQYLVASGRQKSYSILFAISTFLSLILIYFFTKYGGFLATSIAISFGEFIFSLILAIKVIAIRKNKKRHAILQTGTCINKE